MKSSQKGLSIWISGDLVSLIKDLAGQSTPRQFIRNALYEAVGAQRNGVSSAHIVSQLKTLQTTTNTISEQLAERKHVTSKHEKRREQEPIEQAVAHLTIRQEQSLKLLMQIIVTLEDTHAEVLSSHSPPLTTGDRRDTLSEKYRQLKDHLNGEIAQLQTADGKRGAAE